MKRFIKWLIKAVILVVLAIFFVGNLFYINTTVYIFPESAPFSGSKIYNPYVDLPKNCFRANFHAHTVLSNKVTNGHNTEKEMYEAYTARGYDIPSISNYHSISTYAKDKNDLYIPAYEHGYNVFKSHCLGIGVDKVSKFDYPFWQWSSHKQKVIENIKANNGFVAMAHPKFGGGRTFADMERLVYYDFTEVLNHYRNSEAYWDKSLSAGRLTWILGDDDTHDLVKEPTFRIWNVIHCDERNTDSILMAMKKGKHYSIHSKTGDWDNSLKSLNLNENIMTLDLDAEADSIHLIGQGGVVLAKAYQTSSMTYNIEEGDAYVRAVAYNHNSNLYLNPLVRYQGEKIPFNGDIKPRKAILKTWLARLFFALTTLFWLWLGIKVIKK